MNRRELYREYLKSDHWKALRCEAVKKWGDRCCNCDSVASIEVHHLTYRNWIDCTPEDLMPLCDRCHGNVHKSPRLVELLESAEDSAQKRREVLAYLAGVDMMARENATRPKRTVVIRKAKKGAHMKKMPKKPKRRFLGWSERGPRQPWSTGW